MALAAPSEDPDLNSQALAQRTKPVAIRSFLQVLLWPGPVIVADIGACEGEDTLGYAKLYPHARYLLFEPLPRNRRKIEGLLKREKWISGKLYGLALSDQTGTAVLHVSAGDPSGASVEAEAKAELGNKSSSLLAPSGERPKLLDWLEFPEAITVQTNTLDALCREEGIRRVDFIHMDVQGAELKVLRGALGMIKHTSALWMEVAFEATYQGQPLEPEATAFLKERGFRKILQIGYGPEGDALYFNMRHALSWPKLIALKVLQRLRLVGLR